MAVLEEIVPSNSIMFSLSDIGMVTAPEEI